MLHHEVIFDLAKNRVGIAQAHCPEYRESPAAEPRVGTSGTSLGWAAALLAGCGIALFALGRRPFGSKAADDVEAAPEGDPGEDVEGGEEMHLVQPEGNAAKGPTAEVPSSDAQVAEEACLESDRPTVLGVPSSLALQVPEDEEGTLL